MFWTSSELSLALARYMTSDRSDGVLTGARRCIAPPSADYDCQHDLYIASEWEVCGWSVRAKGTGVELHGHGVRSSELIAL